MNALILYVCCAMSNLANAQWKGPIHPILPFAGSYMAVGVYNHTIYIIGGHGENHHANFVPTAKYSITGNTFIAMETHDTNTNLVYPGVYGYGQFYTQQGQNLYWIQANQFESNTLMIARYNLQTETYNSNWKQIPTAIPDHNGCLASSEQYLVLLGGATNATLVLLLDLTDYTWLYNAKRLSTGRQGSVCVVDPQTDTIYVIGGQENAWSNHSQNTIEINHMKSITTDEWMLIDNLPVGVTRARCVLYHTNIFVIGGVNATVGIPMNIVQIIDTKTGQTSISPYILPWGVVGCAAILVDDTIYAFGGQSGIYLDSLNIWMYSALTGTDNTTTVGTQSDHLAIGILIGISIGIVLSTMVVLTFRKITERRGSFWDAQLLGPSNSYDTSKYSPDSVWNQRKVTPGTPVTPVTPMDTSVN